MSTKQVGGTILLMALGGLALLIGGIAWLSFNKMNLKKAPNEETALSLLVAHENEANADLFRRQARDLTDQERGLWKDYFLSNANDLGGRLSAVEALCLGIGFPRELALLSDDWSSVFELCEEYGTRLKRLRGSQSEYDKELREHQRARDNVAAAVRRVARARERIQEFDRRYLHLRGRIQGRLDTGEYEIITNQGERAVLVTTSTSFRTTGNFDMWVETEGVMTVTMQSGFQREFPVVREAPNAASLFHGLRINSQKAQTDLHQAEQALRSSREPESGQLEPLRLAAKSMEEEIKAQLQCLSDETCRPEKRNPTEGAQTSGEEETAGAESSPEEDYFWVSSFPGSEELHTFTARWVGHEMGIALREQPNRDSPALDHFSFTQGDVIDYDKTRVIVTDPEVYVVREPVEVFGVLYRPGSYDYNIERIEWTLEEGEEIEMLDYASEGDCFLRGRGQIFIGFCPHFQESHFQKINTRSRESGDDQGWKSGMQWWLKTTVRGKEGWFEMTPDLFDVSVHLFPEYEIHGGDTY